MEPVQSDKIMEVGNVAVYPGGRVKVVDVPGDGNCFFYAVLQQITGQWKYF